MNDEVILQFFSIEYIKEHFWGLILFLFVFVIIYFVDYINRINLVILSTLNITGVQIPGIPNSSASPPVSSLLNKIIKNKHPSKSKKHK